MEEVETVEKVEEVEEVEKVEVAEEVERLRCRGDPDFGSSGHATWRISVPEPYPNRDVFFEFRLHMGTCHIQHLNRSEIYCKRCKPRGQV